MPNILALANIPGTTNFQIVSDKTTVLIGDVNQTTMFKNAMSRNQVLQYFSDRAALMQGTADWEEVVDMEANGTTIQSLLALTHTFVSGGLTRFVSPPGENLESCLEKGIKNWTQSLASAGDATFAKVLEDLAIP